MKMKMKMKNLTNVFIVSAMLASSAQVSEAGFLDNTYLAIGAGASMPNKVQGYEVDVNNPSQEISVSRKLENSEVYRVAVGKGFNAFRGEVEFTYRKFNHKYTHPIVTDARSQYDIKSASYFLNGYYDFANYSKVFVPYVGAGVGVSRNSLSDEKVYFMNELQMYTPGTKQTSFAWNVGLGTMIHLNQNIAFDLSYKYTDLGKITGKKDVLGADGNPATQPTISVANVQGRLMSNNITASVVFKLPA